jgi:hypothetical protein
MTMLSLFIKTVKAIPEWKLLFWLVIIILTVAGVSFIFHLKTPEEKRTKGIINQPFSFMLLVDIVVILLSLIYYIFSK